MTELQVVAIALGITIGVVLSIEFIISRRSK